MKISGHGELLPAREAMVVTGTYLEKQSIFAANIDWGNLFKFEGKTCIFPHIRTHEEHTFGHFIFTYMLLSITSVMFTTAATVTL